jgi:hypothetical protein
MIFLSCISFLYGECSLYVFFFFVFMNDFIYMFVFSLIGCWQKKYIIKKE